MNNNKDSTFDTEKIPALADEKTQFMPAVQEQKSSFRELPQQKKPPTGNKKPLNDNETPKWKKWVMVIVLFFFSVICSFFLFGYFNDRQQISENEQLRQIQSMREQEADIKKKKEALSKEKENLEIEKKALEQRKKQLEAEAAGAKKRNDEIKKKTDNASAIDKVWDKVSGKEKKRQEEQKENNTTYEKAQNELHDVENALRQSAEIIHEVNEKVQQLQEMQERVEKIQTEATELYESNASIISKALYYFKEMTKIFESFSSSN